MYLDARLSLPMGSRVLCCCVGFCPVDWDVFVEGFGPSISGRHASFCTEACCSETWWMLRVSMAIIGC